MSRVAIADRDCDSPATTDDLLALCRELGLEVIEDVPLGRPVVALFTSSHLYLSHDLAPLWARIFDHAQPHAVSCERMRRLLITATIAAREQRLPLYAFRLPIPQLGGLPPRVAVLLLRAGLLTFGLRYPHTASALADWGGWPVWACRLWLNLMAEQSARSEQWPGLRVVGG